MGNFKVCIYVLICVADCSRHLQLFNSTISKGIIIPYSSITLHAIQTIQPPQTATSRKAIYMQLSLSSLKHDENANAVDEGSYDDEDVVELSIIPSTLSEAETPREGTTANETKPDPVEEFFNALSTCSNLNPDEDASEEEYGGIISEGDYATADDGLPPPFPGSGGWITSENVDSFFDAEGNWIGRESESLGPGAGVVREREEDGTAEDETATDETKWRRTE
jgi:nucleotide-sensitive chloride channel 1A